MRTVKSRAPRRLAALVVASAAVMLAAACGSSGSGSAAGSGTTGGGNGNAGGNAFAAYTECLSKNGVTITLPSRRPRTGASGETFRPGERPSGLPRPSGSRGAGFRGGFPGGRGFQKPAGVDDATWQKAQQACASVRPSFGAGNGRDAAFQNCLKDHGVTATGGNLDPNDATVKKALQICRVLEQPQASPTPTA